MVLVERQRQVYPGFLPLQALSFLNVFLFCGRQFCFRLPLFHLYPMFPIEAFLMVPIERQRGV